MGEMQIYTINSTSFALLVDKVFSQTRTFRDLTTRRLQVQAACADRKLNTEQRCSAIPILHPQMR